MYCTKCGAKLADDSLFCHACGSKVVKLDNVAQDNNVRTHAYSAPPEYSNVSNKEPETGGVWIWIKDKLVTIIFIFFFLVAGGIGKAAGRMLFKQFSFPFIMGMVIGASIVGIIEYFIVKKFGKWEDNDKAAWICTGICFVAHLILGVYFSIPVLLITSIILFMKR